MRPSPRHRLKLINHLQDPLRRQDMQDEERKNSHFLFSFRILERVLFFLVFFDAPLNAHAQDQMAEFAWKESEKRDGNF